MTDFTRLLSKFDVKNVYGDEIRSYPYRTFTAYALICGGRVTLTKIGDAGFQELLGGFFTQELSEEDIAHTLIVSRRIGMRYVRDSKEWYPDIPIEEEPMELPEMTDEYRYSRTPVSELLPNYKIYLGNLMPIRYPIPI